MQIYLQHHGKTFSADLSRAYSIAIPLSPGAIGPNCFYAPFFEAVPVRADNFVGSTKEGGAVNFFNIHINPHGNGTHTECVGHISKEKYTIRECLTVHHFIAKLITLWPEKKENGDRVIVSSLLQGCLDSENPVKAIIVRTMPNGDDKKTRNYSGTNPPYFDAKAIQYLNDCGIEHLLTDLPSVDREEDGGLLSAHKTFWNYPSDPASHKTITELIYVPDSIPDGYYLLNIQITPMDLDVSPSGIIIYPLTES